MARQVLISIASAENCSAAASTTTVGAKTPDGFDDYSTIDVYATLIGPTGGTLDVYIQGSYDGVSWHDWVHFPQVAAAATKTYKASAFLSSTIVELGNGTVGAPALTLPVNTVAPGHPGRFLRAVYVTGAGVSAAGAQTIKAVGTFHK